MLLALLAVASPVAVPPQGDGAGPLAPERWLVLAPVDGRGRRPFRPDAVFARHLADPAAAPPVAGETVEGELGEATWTAVAAGDDGAVPGPVGWAYARLEVDEPGVYQARLSRAWTLFVGGDGFTGDAYGYGHAGVPVALRAGANDVYVTGARGDVRLTFTPLHAGLVIHERGARVDAEATPPAGSVPAFRAGGDAEPRLGTGLTWREPFLVAPLAMGDLAFRAPERDGTGEPGETLAFEADGAPVELRRERDAAIERRVFASNVDGSLQEYAVVPPAAEEPDTVRGVVLTLHGAGVGPMDQARAYSAKADFWIVVPTNRSPYGFDWQDWGRADAYEVLADFERETFGGHSGARVFLTGHSMGGHGVWSLAANDPDRFAAIAPSAGWRSFDTYGGRPESARLEPWRGADLASDTTLLAANLVGLPTLVLHGEDDDNVPVAEARGMVERLRELGAEPSLHVQPGAGHWWDGDAAPGADCVDWPGVFELFRSVEAGPAVPSELRWTSAGPGVDADHHWLHLDQVLEGGRPVTFEGTWDANAGRVELATSNARRFSVRGLPVARAVVDGFEFDVTPLLERAESAAGHAVDFVLIRDKWRVDVDEGWRRSEKTALATGPFKRAFDRRFVLVYGTAGDDALDAELLARARHDQQVWWYRANGVAALASDVELLAAMSGRAWDHRNVILYGNEATNRAWRAVVPATASVRVGADSIAVGDDVFEGTDLACLFVVRQAGASGEAGALVGVFGSTGVVGARLGYTLSPFVSGVGYPDYAVFSSEVLAEGAGGVLAAGWFDETWRIPPPPPDWGGAEDGD